MPWLPFYASEEDFDTLRNHVNATDDLAYLVACGPGQWKAVRSLGSIECGRYGLWHVPSGPLPLLHSGSESSSEVEDPFSGWSELRPGADSSTPYFGAGHPGVFWLNLRAGSTSRHGVPVVGLSSFEWIGNHYRIIGKAAVPQTEASWKMLRRWVAESTSKVPRGGPTETTSPEIWAFPGAEALFFQGAKGGNV
jgi:hypothetical protein